MPLPVDIEVRGLFATPVAAIQVPDSEAINEDLAPIILKRRSEIPSVQASNAGGWHSDREIPDWGGPRIAALIDLIKGAAGQLTADKSGQTVKPPWKVQAWANVNAAGHGNLCHYHPASFWSGTYYVADGGCATDHSLGGEFEMLDPRGPAPGMYAPLLKFFGEDGASVGGAEIIRPKPGLMFLFPSWLMHQVRPYRGNGTRISIAFNLSL